MKYFVVVLFCIAVCVTTAADLAVKFTPVDTWQQALDQAKAENRYLFVDAYTDWCHWCKVMDKETFTSAEVGALMNDKFMSIKVEMESGWGIDLAMKYGVRSFPTFLIFAPDGKLVQRVAGYQPPADFITTLNNSLDPVTQNPEIGYGAGSTPHFPDFMRTAYLKGKERKYPDSAVVEMWLKSQKDWSTEESWGVIYAFSPPVSKDFVVTNRKQLQQKYGRTVSENLDRRVGSMVFKATKAQSEELFNEAIVLKRMIADGESITRDSTFYRLNYYDATKQYDKLSTTLLDGVKQEFIGLQTANNYAWNMYEHCTDKAALTRASDALNICLQRETPDYACLDTYAALLYKTQCFPQAEQTAEKAIKLGKEKGEDVTGTEALLKQIRAR